MTPRSALARRAWRDGRTRTLSFGSLFLIYAYIQPVGYRHTYATAADRLGFARSFGGNTAIRLFYGEPHDLLSTGGYTAWRVGGVSAILAALWGLLAAVRALRAEEDAGRTELVLSGVVARRDTFAAAAAAIVTGIAAMLVAMTVGLLAGALAFGDSLLLALATMSVAFVFAGIGALSSQLAPTRRVALELGTGVLAVFFVARVIADTSSGAGWLRWLTPLGWAEDVRPFTGARPLVLLLALVTGTLLFVVSARLSLRRDTGGALLRGRDRAAPRLSLLSSANAQALRGELGSLAGWGFAVAVLTFVFGSISTAVTTAGIPQRVSDELQRLGISSISTPTGYLGVAFLFVIVVVCAFCCAQIGAARNEEAEGRLETLLCAPVARRGWLGGRAALAVAGAVALALVAGLFAWAGTQAAGADVGLGKMLEAGLNALPAALLFLGGAALAFALVPRIAAGLAYGALAVAFLWQLVGGLLGAPSWVVKLTPFSHIGFVPAQSLKAGEAAAMLAGGAVAMALALWAFARRDLTGA